MTTSNIKFKGNSREAPTEPFKRAVTSCLRAIAKSPELEVTFAAERPGLSPGKARLPEPARKLSKRDAAIVRGHADSMALKLACHDAKLHRKLMPASPQARGGLRGRRAGPRRGARRPPHGRRGEESHRHARRPLSSRQVRRGHRPRRCAVRGCGRADGARTADRPGATDRAPRSWSTSGAPCSRTSRAAARSVWTATPRTRASSATPCTICCRRSTSATNATPTPTRTSPRRKSRGRERPVRRRWSAPSPRPRRTMSADQAEATSDDTSESSMRKRRRPR